MSPLAAYVVETLVTVVAVAALAVVTLVAARRAGLGRPSGPLSLVGRLPIDARRAVYLVRVGKQVLVLGASEAGLTRLGELDADAVGAPEAAPAPAFRDVLARIGVTRAPAPARDARGDDAA